MRRNVLAIATVFMVLLSFGSNVAIAQKKNPIVPEAATPESVEWKRVLEGLKKAKPMPEPHGTIAPKTPTAPGDLAHFDPKTGQSSVAPASVLPNRPGLQRSPQHPGTEPTPTKGGAAPTGASSIEGLDTPGATSPAPRPYATTAPGPLTTPYSFPYRTVGRLLMRFNVAGVDYYYLCSASTASSFHMISAGHCIYNHDIKNDGSNIAGFANEVWAWVTETDVVDPVDHTNWPDFPYGVAKMTWEVTYTAWINSSDRNWDFAFLTFDRRIGDHVGWMGREYGTPTSSLNFDGYPAEAPYVPSDNDFQYPGYDANNVIGYTCCRIQLNAFVYGGHSGGPEWRFDGTNRYVQGVNSTSNRTGYAEGTLLTNQIFNDLANQISSDQIVRPPVDLAQVIEYVFDGNQKSLGQTSTEIGFAFPFTLNAFNAGYADAGDTRADIYLTKDPNNVGGGTFIKNFDFGYLGTYSFTTQTPNITVPTYVLPGFYDVGYILSAANSQYGTDKNSVVITNQTMSVYCNSDGFEPDDFFSQASRLFPSSPQSRSICNNNIADARADQDWAYFIVGASSGASIFTDGYPGGDTTMTLYDNNLTQIDFNDDNGVNGYSTINRVCGTNPLPAGKYYVLIQSFRNATIIPNYTLSLNTNICPVPSSTTLTASASAVKFGNAVSFTATIKSTTPGTPTGTVTFNDGSTAMGTATVSGGKAIFTTQNLSRGTHKVVAIYGGDAKYLGSTSGVVTVSVDRAATSTGISASSSSSVYGKPVIFKAKVKSSTIGTPTGTVFFKDGTTTIGVGTLSGGTATFTTQKLTAGTHKVTAAYAGDVSFVGSASATLSHSITQAHTSSSVLSSQNPSKKAKAVTFTATVKSSTTGTPTGTVTFKDGTTAIGTGTLNSSAKASFSTTKLGVGKHQITAVYGGNIDFVGSTSPALTQTVNP